MKKKIKEPVQTKYPIKVHQIPKNPFLYSVVTVKNYRKETKLKNIINWFTSVLFK